VTAPDEKEQPRVGERADGRSRVLLVSMKAGPLSSPCVSSLTPHCHSPGERCRVKRRSKFTCMNVGGSWRLTRQREPGTRLSRAAGGLACWSSAHFSIASSTSRTRCYRGSLRWRISKMDCQAVRRERAPAGAKGLNGWLRVSMYQIASVSLRASSICATLAPRWRPRRRLVRW
jgi:hypothetical protein